MRRLARRAAVIAACLVVVFVAASVALGAVTGSGQAAVPSKPAPAVHVNLQDGAWPGGKPAAIVKTTTR